MTNTVIYGGGLKINMTLGFSLAVQLFKQKSERLKPFFILGITPPPLMTVLVIC